MYLYNDDGEEYFVILPSENDKEEKLMIPIEEELYRELHDKYLKPLDVPPGEYAEVNQDWIAARFEREE